MSAIFHWYIIYCIFSNTRSINCPIAKIANDFRTIYNKILTLYNNIFSYYLRWDFHIVPTEQLIKHYSHANDLK